MTRTFLAAAMVVVLAQPAWADRPPSDALPLSQVLRMLEDQHGVAFFDEVEWDNDGYWEIDYIARDGARREIRVDPRTGQELARR